MVEEKKKSYEEWLQRRSRRMWKLYREIRKECKRVVRRAKRNDQRRWGKKLQETLGKDKSMFWKEVRRKENGREGKR